MIVKEFVVNDHIKIVYVCENDHNCLVIGDLPALPWCFEVEDELSISVSKLRYRSIEANIGGNNVRLIIEGAEILSKLRSIGFVIYGIRGDLPPNILYNEVKEYVMKTCESTKE